MKVHLTNFKDTKSASYSFNKQEIVLLSGESGCGKSSVFEAVLWCFYGKVRDIDKRGVKSSQIKVTVEFEDAVITRKKSPAFISFSSERVKLQGDEAQQEIEKYLLGNEDCWISTSYVVQEQCHYVMTLPAKDRYLLLMKLSMRGVDPEPVLRDIKERIKKQVSEVNAREVLLNKKTLKYEECSENGYGYDEILSEEKKEEFLRKIEESGEKKVVLRRELIKAENYATKSQVYLTSAQSLKTQILGLKDHTQDGLASLKKKCNSYNSYCERKKKYEVLDGELTKLKSTAKDKVIPRNCTEEEIVEAQTCKQLYSRQKEACKKIRIEYEQDIIVEEISRLEVLTKSQENARLFALVKAKSTERDKLISSLVPSTENEAELLEKISSLELSHSFLQRELGTEQEKLVETLTKKRDLEKELIVEEYAKKIDSVEVTFSERKKREKNTNILSELECRLTDSRKQLEESKKSQESHACPHCSESIRIVSGKLEKSSIAPHDSSRHSELQRLVKEKEKEIVSAKNSSESIIARLNLEKRNLLKTLVQEKTQKLEEASRLYKTSLIDGKRELSDKYEKKTQEKSLHIKKLNQDLALRREYIKNKTRAQELTAELEQLPQNLTREIPLLSQQELEAAKAKLKTLQGIIVYELPQKDPEVMRASKKAFLTKKRVDEIQSELSSLDIVEVNKVTEKDVAEYSASLLSLKEKETELEKIELQLQELQCDKTPEDITKSLTLLKRRKKTMNNKLAISTEAEVVVKKYEELLELTEECEAKKVELTKLQTSFSILEEGIVHCIQSLLNHVNFFFETHLPALFKDPVVIQLKTEKCLKSGKKKQEINLEIVYKGGIVQNFKTGLSGGERSRITSLLTMAFSTYCGSKVLVLDETLSYLDDGNIEALVKVIESVVKSEESSIQACLLASQNCYSGVADRIISFSK